MLFSEPKIPQFQTETPSVGMRTRFQCSSASRKFLNAGLRRVDRQPAQVSVLFSEPKIPQSTTQTFGIAPHAVSVLFSEPKIPQFTDGSQRYSSSVSFQCSSASRKFLNSPVRPPAQPRSSPSFSALQRAENSSIGLLATVVVNACTFQCSSASRKFLNPDPRTCVHPYFRPR